MPLNHCGKKRYQGTKQRLRIQDRTPHGLPDMKLPKSVTALGRKRSKCQCFGQAQNVVIRDSLPEDSITK
jgi:hypothetical protein